MFASKKDLENLLRRGRLGKDIKKVGERKESANYLELTLGSIKRLHPEGGVISPQKPWKPNYGPIITEGEYCLSFNDCVWAETREKIHIPKGYNGIIYPSLNAMECGLHIDALPLSEKYKGTVSFSLSNQMSAGVQLSLDKEKPYSIVRVYLQPTTEHLDSIDSCPELIS